VTVRAEHPKILDPVVIANTVDMVDLNREWFAPPFVDSAQRAAIHQYTSLDQAALDHLSLGLQQNALDREALYARSDLAAPNGLRPRGGAKAESFGARSVRMAFVVVALHGAPVVSLPRVGVWFARRVDADIAQADRLRPRGVRDTEPQPAPNESVPGVDIRLHRLPVKPLASASSCRHTNGCSHRAMPDAWHEAPRLRSIDGRKVPRIRNGSAVVEV
jgi:hypothetical protein